MIEPCINTKEFVKKTSDVNNEDFAVTHYLEGRIAFCRHGEEELPQHMLHAFTTVLKTPLYTGDDMHLIIVKVSTGGPRVFVANPHPNILTYFLPGDYREDLVVEELNACITRRNNIEDNKLTGLLHTWFSHLKKTVRDRREKYKNRVDTCVDRLLTISPSTDFQEELHRLKIGRASCRERV